MDLIKLTLTGIGLLIFAYLLGAGATGYAKVLGAGGPVVTSTIKTLQGR